MQDAYDIAIIDDDTLQVMILQEMCLHANLSDQIVFHHFESIEIFKSAENTARFCAVILDHRLPPFRNYDDSLQAISETNFDGPVLLVSTVKSLKPKIQTRFRLLGPIEKSEFSHPPALGRHLTHLIRPH